MNIINHIKHRKALDLVKPYIPGKPLWEVQKELRLARVIKLASNENPIGASPNALEVISNSLTRLNRYPDAHAVELKAAIASNLSLTTKQLIITNGADELITLISETYLEAEDEIIVPSPSFSEYDFGAHLMGAKVVPVPLDNEYQFNIDLILSAVTDRTKLVYICSPNNPTGTYLPKSKLEELLQSLPNHILVVFDSAYSHFATNEDYTNGLEYVRSGYPIIVLQTFSKIFGLAGLRVGFGVAPENIIQSIVRVKEPFNVNSLAQVAAAAAIMDEEHVEKSKQVNTAGRQQLYKAFRELGLEFIESMSNFILVKFGHNANEIYQQLLCQGVIVRYGDTWGMPQHLRISVGTADENTILIEEICSIMKRQLIHFKGEIK
ncbi:histidinol-phosphate aminotransferase [Neobacillus niacini]|uniref:histidinol-phosphate transaminase n=1 Tax=Neobacillus driksii TaxID=3035913 RepID=UPI0027891427|nr:histidinol-phosphate transaminase [Neobacillus niacini]MDQ0970460.1 histidinol-phosphate aminotransferase [Neobacillus niacini]